MTYQCEICERSFCLEIDLIQHVIEVFERGTEICSHCNYETNDKEDIKNHIHVHLNIQDESNSAEPEPSLESDLCVKNFTTSKEIKKIKIYECYLCNRRFLRKYGFIFHYWKDHKHLTHQCLHCDYKTNDTENLKNHIRRVQSNSQEGSNSAEPTPSFESDACGKHSSRSRDIEKRKNIFYECHVCNQRFSRMYELICHYRKVQKHLKHQCEHCDYKTTDTEDLRSHIQHDHPNIQEDYDSAEPVPSLVSDPCSKYFSRSSDIKKNILYQCEICERSFYCEADLIQHMIEVVERGTDICSHCNYKTDDKENLKIHIRHVHPNIQEENNSEESASSLESNACGKHSRSRSSDIEKYKNMLYECDVCNQRFCRKYELICHYRMVHKNLMHECEHCDYETIDKEDLKRHIRHIYTHIQDEILDNSAKLESSMDHYPCDEHSSRSSDIEKCKNMLYQCEVCEQKFYFEIDLMQHAIEVLGRGTDICSYCNYATNNEKDMKAHIRHVHHNIQGKSNSAEPEPLLESIPCDKHSSRNSEIKKYENMLYECDVCIQRFARKYELIHHYRKVHKHLMHQCELCGYEITDKEDLRSHIQRVHSNIQEESNSAGLESFLDHDPYDEHSSRNSDIEKCEKMLYQCEVCEQSFYFEIDLMQHAMEVLGRGTDICSYCNYATNNEEDLKVHIRHVHHNIQGENNSAELEPLLESDPCNKHSSRSSDIEKYKNMLYECDVCNQRFPRKYDLICHYRKVHKHLMYQCEHCDYETTDKKVLISHIQCIHPNVQKESNSAQPEPSWESDPCGKHFSRSSDIKKYKNMLYECKVCNQRLPRKYELICHYRKVHKHLLYQCEHCDYETIDKEDLRSHIQRAHPNIQEESNSADPSPALVCKLCWKH
ncbi:Zinc finger protein Xfin [Harpegnathos saltator]|uniref:Zinc finger protein Xfin n=1 Tax=Harpegnathos saltator TaxID=610380 RepID=E2BAP7_HARSA|nr:Zinc finger protein Xfin [Harpegnathos saltator]